MDAFALSFAYGILNIRKKLALITSIIVGIFHFIMPLLGNLFGNYIFENVSISPKYVMFIVFFILSINMFLSFFEKDKRLINLNVIGVILFAFSVSLDSFSVGLGLSYLSDNIILSSLIFCIISATITNLGFVLGKKISDKYGKYPSFIGAIILFLYSIHLIF